MIERKRPAHPMKWFIFHSIILATGWWYAELNSTSAFEAGWAPAMMMFGAIGVFCWIVMRFPGVSRKTGGGAGISSGDSGDSG